MYPSSLEQLGALGNVVEDPIDEETGEDQKDVYKMVGNNFLLKKIEISIAEAERGGRAERNVVNMKLTLSAYGIKTWSAEHADSHEFQLLSLISTASSVLPTHVVPPPPEKQAEFLWHKVSTDMHGSRHVER